MVTNKTVKASLFTLILAFIVIGTVAIAGVMKNEIIQTEVYLFHGNAGEEHLPEMYSLSTGTPSNCSRDGIRCEISAKANPSNPTQPLLDGTEVVLNRRP